MCESTHQWETLTVSLMRGIIENAIKNMTPEERDKALQSVMEQVVSMMSPEERRTSLVYIVAYLAGDLSSEDRAAVIRSVVQ